MGVRPGRPKLRFSKTPKVTSLEQHCRNKKHIPGPNKYENRLKKKIRGVYMQNAIVGGLMNQSVYYSKLTPGPNQY